MTLSRPEFSAATMRVRALGPGPRSGAARTLFGVSIPREPWSRLLAYQPTQRDRCELDIREGSEEAGVESGDADAFGLEQATYK